jgi:quercetin dioxygenase-like cupin family protein
MSATVALRHWADIATETVTDGIERKFLTGDSITVAHFQLKRGSLVPRHSHESEQITQVLKGVLKFAIDGREIILREGDVLQIPSWIEHEVEVLEDTFAIDVFSPVRQDWIDGTDDYFRR